MVISKDFIQETIEFWSSQYGYRISEQEALEIIEICTQLLVTMKRYSEKQREKSYELKIVKEEC